MGTVVEVRDAESLDALTSWYEDRVLTAAEQVLKRTARQLDPHDPIHSSNVVRTLWKSKVDGLVADLGQAYYEAQITVRDQLQRLANAVTAAVDVDPGAYEIPPPQDLLAELYLQSRANFIENIGTDVWTDVQTQLVDGMKFGESITELRDRVRAVAQLSAWRAERIARTEIVGASNAGAYAQMQASGLEATKTWLATGDTRTRPSHRAASGQTVSMNEKFEVGDALMDRPHDPLAPVEEIVQCRCTLTFEVPDDALTAAIVTETDNDHTSGMIALVPTAADAARLALAGGEPRDELHLTLFFLSDAASYTTEQRDALVASIESATPAGVITGNAFGINYWNPASDEPAWVLAVSDTPEDGSLVNVHAAVEQAYCDAGLTMPMQHSPWVPHVTIAYGTDDILTQLEDRIGPITFDRIRVAFASTYYDVVLTDERATLTAADGGGEMPWKIVDDHADCPAGKPYAVVKESDGSVEGCHATRGEADDHMKALYANENESVAGAEDLGGKPSPGTKKDKRLHENDPEAKKAKATSGTEGDGGENGTFAGDEFGAMMGGSEGGDSPVAPWEGVLVVEGVTTGDGREFAPDALTWRDLPIPLRWNKEDSHGGEPHTVAVNVGNITDVWRDGNQIHGKGNIDLATEDGRTVYGKLKGEFLRGVSIDADSIADADVELVYPDTEDVEDDSESADMDGLLFLFGPPPEKVIFHGGRISAATLCDIPAFAEAYIQLVGEPMSDATVAALAVKATATCAVSPHRTATSDAPWDRPTQEKRLAARLTVASVREAFAWVNDTTRGFLHHEIADDGQVGPANLTACAAGIAALNSGASITLSTGDRRAVYAHLAQHLRDAGQEAPPATFETAVVAAAVVDDRPPAAWFTDPKLSLLTPITVTDDGRVYGHAAEWGECHVGIQESCVQPPHEDIHPYFMTGEVACDDGSRVAVGQITLGTGHANLSLGAAPAAEHYDNTGCAVADVAVGNDEHGIWVAGAIRPGTDIHRVRELRASGQVSGDWRRIGGQLRLVGLLAVNVPGYPVPKLATRVASGAQLALVAAGRPTIAQSRMTEADLERIALRAVANRLAARIGRPAREV